MPTGEVKSTFLEYVLSGIGMLVIALLIFLAGGLGLFFGLPYFAAGAVGGLIVSILIITGSFAGTTVITCPECGTEHRVAIKAGSYQCSACGHREVIKPRDVKGLYAYYPPTD